MSEVQFPTKARGGTGRKENPAKVADKADLDKVKAAAVIVAAALLEQHPAEEVEDKTVEDKVEKSEEVEKNEEEKVVDEGKKEETVTKKRATPEPEDEPKAAEESGPMTWGDVFEDSTESFRNPKRLKTDSPTYSAPLNPKEIDQTKGEPADGISMKMDLDLEQVFIGEEGTFNPSLFRAFLVAENLEDCLCVDERTGKMTRIDASRSGKWLDKKRIERLRWALSAGLPVTSLNLSYCPDIARFNHRLVEAATQGGHLEVLSLEGCDLKDLHVTALAPALEANTTLRGLDLTGNLITEKGGLVLMDVIEKRTGGSFWLRLTGNSVGDKVLERLEAFYLNGKMDMQIVHDISTSMM